MYQFIFNIYDFLKQIISTFISVLSNSGAITLIFPTASSARDAFISFMAKDVFIDTSIIGFNITWQELILFFGTLFIVVLSIVLFIRYFLKLLGLFRLD